MSSDPTKSATPEEQAIETIAAEHLGVRSLKPQGSDRSDFHQLHVDGVRAALLAAFRAGAAAAEVRR